MSYEISTITIRKRSDEHYLVKNVYTDSELFDIDYENFLNVLDLSEYDIRTNHIFYTSESRFHYVLAMMRPDYYYVH